MFSTTNPLLPEAQAAARVFYKSLPSISLFRRVLGVYFDHIYLHWTAGPWGHLDGAYNAEVDLENGKWVMAITHPPLDNAISITDGPYAAHTLGRNSHAFGIAITGMVGATSGNFGAEGAQLHELEFLCACAAAVAQRYGLDASGTVRNEPVIMTHAEAAIADDYFGERWDLERFEASSAPLSIDEAKRSGNLLRIRIHQYKAAGMT